MLKARSVAVVGASQNPSKFSSFLLRSIISGGFTGSVYPVNPSATEIDGLRCYPNVSSIPGSLDLAVIAVPARYVPGVLDEAADKGAAGAFVISAGFRESGRPDLEQEIVEIARQRGMRLFGPNIQGVAYAANRLSAVFWPAITTPGPIAVVGQSGTVVAALTDWAQSDGFGASASVSLGNQADVCESDVLRLLADDEGTRSIALYLEGVDDGARFISALRDVAPKKPVAVLKCGHSQLGRAAVASHTGSLAGSDRVFEGVCRQYGVVRANGSESLYDAAKMLAARSLPGGRRVLVVSSSGGTCALAADAAEEHGLILPPLPAEYVETLRQMGLPGWGSFANPLDMASVALDDFRTAVQTADAMGLADVILLVYGDPIPGGARLACELAAGSRATVCATVFGGGATGLEESYDMQRAGIPVYPTAERAMRAISATCWYAEARRAREVRG
jgi:acyl-CoA synthetase (NDP forming)